MCVVVEATRVCVRGEVDKVCRYSVCWGNILVGKSRCIVCVCVEGGGRCGRQRGNSLLSTPKLFKYRPTLPHCPLKYSLKVCGWCVLVPWHARVHCRTYVSDGTASNKRGSHVSMAIGNCYVERAVAMIVYPVYRGSIVEQRLNGCGTMAATHGFVEWRVA